jgi:hypothetical protein
MPTGFVPGFMSTPITDRKNRPRMEAHLVFGTFVLLSAIVFWRTLGALVAYSVHNESGSHIILIPLVSASLLSAIVDVLEQNRRYRNLNPHSEPQLGRRNLYRRVDRRLESRLTRASGVLNLVGNCHIVETVFPMAQLVRSDSRRYGISSPATIT